MYIVSIKCILILTKKIHGKTIEIHQTIDEQTHKKNPAFIKY